MLKIKDRQTYLKYLGFYKGKVDGKEGKLTKEAYKKLQKKYFTRKKDIDGLYGTNTDILLINAYRVKKYTKNFALSEFKCECGGKYCTGYPKYLSIYLLKNIQKIRDKCKVPMKITSGLRCTKFNNSLVGSIKNSKHTQGKAIDFHGTLTNTRTKRNTLKKYWYTLPKSSYTYSDTPNMGTSIHVDVK